MSHDLRTEIEIDAPPEAVWSHLIDLPAFAEWNPFITSAAGTPAIGERLELRMQPPGGKAMGFRPTVTEVKSARVFEWLGRLGVSGVFDGRHRFELVPTDTGTRLIHSEQFSGLLVRMFRRKLDTATRSGFEAMNTALAQRVMDAKATV